MSEREPFFLPVPTSEPDVEEGPRSYHDVPFAPPEHVAGVTVALDAPVARTPDTVVRLERVTCYPRGLAIALDTWLRPTTEPGEVDWRRPGGLEPRVGVQLEDGSRLGADPGGDLPEPEGDGEAGTPMPPVGIALRESSSSTALHGTTTVWVFPFPEGDRADLVLAWPARDIDETFVPVDLAALRRAMEGAEMLWPLPQPENEHFGWFSYGPVLGRTPPAGSGG
ncbi:MAG TPA: hypothetical protein VES95_00070 [Dermatophilaceae bacterium]|nr:hypothetical protein [Dermatophilaceae bacterium]